YAANQSAKVVKIEMLIDDYGLKNPIEIKKNVLITTASKDDATLPYKGKNDTAKITLQTDLSTDDKALITISSFGKLSLEDIIIDGNGDKTIATQSLISNKEGILEIYDGTKIVNYHGSESTIYNNGILNMFGGSITDNTSAISSEAGGIYQSGTMSVQGEVVIKGNKSGNDVSNVYLPQTSTEKPYTKYISISGELLSGSEIGVMTNTSPNATDKGIENTVIAIPGAGVGNMEKFFFHDQKKRTANAYDIVNDNRVDTSKNLVLQDHIDGIEFEFTKVNENGDNLAGARFELYRCTNTDGDHEHDYLAGTGTCWDKYKTTTSTSDGLVDFRKLVNGEHMLSEVNAPEGYDVPMGQWLILIDNNVEPNITITAHGIKGTNQEEHSFGLPPAFIVDDSGGEDVLKLPNYKAFKLPYSGNRGIYIFLIIGGLLVLIACTGLWRKHRAKPEF
ncbi:MAG: SpaA isopeptide-forming pilin-related protein, partial [Suipraeoptans sp.]